MRKTNIKEEDLTKTMINKERKTLGESSSRSWRHTVVDKN